MQDNQIMQDNSDRDTIYADRTDRISGFVFDETVAEVFPDMIRRSVPGYETIVHMTGILASRFAKPDTFCYDLGCALGASTLAVYARAQDKIAGIVAVDNSEAMIKKAYNNIKRHGCEEKISFICGNIQDIKIKNASSVLMNFTLQFIKHQERDSVIKGICKGMVDNGIMILSEKICFPDKSLDALHTEMHHAFKRLHGYSELEISRKRSALEEVLVPETIPQHINRLKKAGFASCEVWFQCLNFVSIIAIKQQDI